MHRLILALWLLAAPATDLWLLQPTCFLADEPEVGGRYVQADAELGGYGPTGDGYILGGFLFRQELVGPDGTIGPDSTWTRIIWDEMEGHNYYVSPSAYWPEERAWGEAYRLRLVVDPDDRIEETDERNNVAETDCIYADGTVG